MGWQTFLKTCRLGGLEIVISLRRTLPTQVTRQRGSERTHYIIQNWLRNRNTIEFLGIWEQLNNPDFNPIEFDGIRKQGAMNGQVSFCLPSVDAPFFKEKA